MAGDVQVRAGDAGAHADSGEAEQVVVPGAEGDFAVLAGHAPVISTLRPGILEITQPTGKQRIFVKKGVAEADPGRLTVLAQTAVAMEDLDAAQIAAELKAAEAELLEAKDDQSKRMAEILIDLLRRMQAKSV